MANKQKAHIHSQAACALWHSQGKRDEIKKKCHENDQNRR